MATARKVNLPLDEDLIRRARDRDSGQAGKSDAEVIEHALTMDLGDRAFDEALAQGRSATRRLNGSLARSCAPPVAKRRDPRGPRRQRPDLGVHGGVEGPPRRLIYAWREGRFSLVVSPALLDELTTVLGRPKFYRWTGNDRGTL